MAVLRVARVREFALRRIASDQGCAAVCMHHQIQPRTASLTLRRVATIARADTALTESRHD
jgi:hypothetical protein